MMTTEIEAATLQSQAVLLGRAQSTTSSVCLLNEVQQRMQTCGVRSWPTIE